MALTVSRRVTGPFAENTYVALDAETGAAAIVDPGLGALAFWREVEREKGATLERILLTHAHLDHIFGLGELHEAYPVPVHMHPDDLFLIENYVQIAADWGFEVDPAPRPDHPYGQGDTLRIGRCELRVRHTPGHSPGSVCLAWEDGMFTGDTIMGFSIGRTDFPRSSAAQLVQSIRDQIYTLPDRLVIYPGHMEPTTIGDEKRFNQFVPAAERD